MGNLIPAGTGLAAYRKLKVTAVGEPMAKPAGFDAETPSEADAQ